MKIVVLDGYTENPGDLSWEGLERLGAVEVYDRTPVGDVEEILRRIGDADAVYTNKTPLCRTVIEGCPRLRFIGMLSTGYDVVDCAAARERGIPVCNVPSYGTRAVSQFAMALLLEICHHVGHHDAAVHAGRWSGGADWCFWDYPLMELAGKTMGIVGFGRIGQATGQLARAFGMEVLACDTRPSGTGRALAQYVNLDDLLARSDVVVLHCPLSAETAGLIRAENIAKMKEGAILINNSRGGLVVEADLARALAEGKLSAAGLDVVSTEPIRPDNPLLTAPNCLITPHISWASRESRKRLMDTAVDNLARFLRGAAVNVVN